MSPGQVHQNFYLSCYQITCPCQGKIDYQWIFYLSTRHWIKIYACPAWNSTCPGHQDKWFFYPWTNSQISSIYFQIMSIMVAESGIKLNRTCRCRNCAHQHYRLLSQCQVAIYIVFRVSLVVVVGIPVLCWISPDFVSVYQLVMCWLQNMTCCDVLHVIRIIRSYLFTTLDGCLHYN